MDVEDLLSNPNLQQPPVFLTDAQFKAEIEKCKHTFSRNFPSLTPPLPPGLGCESKPCQTACPCDCSPADFIMAMKACGVREVAAQEGTLPLWLSTSALTNAAALITSAVPLGGVCGVACPDSFCMKACARAALDTPVNIPAVQAYIIRKARDHGVFPRFTTTPSGTKGGRRVLIVGGGPTGLTCAAMLASKGQRVLLLEERANLGGSTRSIPLSRLPSRVIDDDIDFVLSSGLIEVRLNTRVQSLRDTMALEGVDVCCVATGVQKPRRLGIQGEEQCCIQAMDYLWNSHAYPVAGMDVAVIGGGPVAVDVASTCMQRGARSVSLLYRRCYASMSLTQRERDTLTRLGCDVLTNVVPVRVEGNSSSSVSALVVRRCRVAGDRGDGARVECIGPELTLTEFKCVIVSIGGGPDRSLQEASSTDVVLPPNVVWAGDYIRGASTVVEASAFGKACARAILRYLEEPSQSSLASLLLATSSVTKNSDRLVGYNPLPVPLETSWFDIPLSSPFVLSASPLTDGFDECRRALQAGWAGVVTKTAFCQQYIHVPDRYMAKFGGGNSYGNCDNVSALPLETHCANISLLRKEFPNCLIAGSTGGSLTGSVEADRASWVKHTKMLEAAGAMLVEYSLSCPQGGEGAEAGMIASQNCEMSARIVDWVLGGGTNPNIPKVFKLTAAVSNIATIVSAVHEVFARYPGAKAGITLANSFPAMDSSWAPGQPIFSRVVGLSGEAVLPITRAALAGVPRNLRMCISANGGIISARHAAEVIALGCSSVQICTAATVLGLHYIDHLKRSLSHLLAENGIARVEMLRHKTVDFMGLNPNKSISYLHARQDCVKCSNCTRCPYGAISMDIEDGGYPRIDPARCVGCSVCVLKCPTGALSMRPRKAQEESGGIEFAKSLGIVWPPPPH